MEEKMDLRIQKTYLALHNAFTQLLEEKRFDELTVNALCEKAMIRRTTFYKHFADKFEYFTFYTREMVSTFQDQLAPDVMDGEAGAYFLHMSRELLRFLRLHRRMFDNVKSSSAFPLLLNILLEQITEDMVLMLRRSSPTLAQDPKKLRGTAAFYAGGMLNALFQLMLEGDSPDEDAFLEVIKECTMQLP